MQKDQWRTDGSWSGSNAPTPNRKDCCRKMILFPNALFLATDNLKIEKIQFFYWIFHRDVFFPTKLLVFVETLENVSHGFEKDFQNWLKYCIFCNFLKESFGKFSKVLRRQCGRSQVDPPTRLAISLTPSIFVLRRPPTGIKEISAI